MWEWEWVCGCALTICQEGKPILWIRRGDRHRTADGLGRSALDVGDGALSVKLQGVSSQHPHR